MVKIHLVASAALVLCASVCSALDLFDDYRYKGTLCRMKTPVGTCVTIPDDCKGNVLSVLVHEGWLCQFFAEACGGLSHVITKDTPAFENVNWQTVTCWMTCQHSTRLSPGRSSYSVAKEH
ncbi:hypothetical protein B0O80DRAFT_430735 [Mortierella sp. GBAus27b]|nr:hypothetical protein B0O80DRAFT_430735 [Mortierella sp. GBAus27b]